MMLPFDKKNQKRKTKALHNSDFHEKGVAKILNL